MTKPCKVCGDYRSPAAEYQDKTYGKGVRVFNARPAGKLRCTVCGAESSDSTPAKEPKHAK